MGRREKWAMIAVSLACIVEEEELYGIEIEWNDYITRFSSSPPSPFLLISSTFPSVFGVLYLIKGSLLRKELSN